MTTWSLTPRGADEVDVTAANAGAVTPVGTFAVGKGTGGIIKFDTAFPLFGSSNMRITPGSTVSTECTWSTMGSLTKGFARWYMRLSAYPNSIQRMSFGFSNTSTEGLGFDLSINGALIGKYSGSQTNMSAMTNVVPLNQWVRIEMGFDSVPTACRPFLSLYNNPFSSTATETVQVATNVSIGTAINTFRTPVRFNWSGQFNCWIDNLEVSDVAMPALLPDPNASVGNTGDFFPFLAG